MQNELKPCPLCGGEAEIFSFNRKAFGVWKVKYFCVRCKVCGYSGRISRYAIEAWNRRANEK